MYMVVERQSGGNEERAQDLRADRLEALVNLAFLLRSDINSREKTEIYLDMMDRVLAGMASEVIRQRDEFERGRYV